MWMRVGKYLEKSSSNIIIPPYKLIVLVCAEILRKMNESYIYILIQMSNNETIIKC